MFTMTEILPNVLHVEFESTHMMCATLGRVQEYAEGPKLHHTVVSWSKLKKYHLSQGFIRVYNDSWIGFNIPSWAFREFVEKCSRFKPKEKQVIDAIMSRYPEGDFYVIADADKHQRKPLYKSGDHELAHALFGTNAKYRAAAQAVLKTLPMREALLVKIKKMQCYAEHVWEDELHAYLTTDSVSVFTSRFHIKMTEELELAKKALEANFARLKETRKV